MASTYLNRRWGETANDPTVQEVLSALDELDKPDPEHPDCWLSDEAGWSISAHETGLLVLENVETGEGPWHIPNCERKLVLELWQTLQRGGLKSIKGYDWLEGYCN